MGLFNVIINDHRNRTCEKILNIRGETEELITNNIAEIQKTGIDVNMFSISNNFTNEEIEKSGWKIKEGLYDSLIIEYNNNGGKILKRWI
jgi:hypothetical protein